MRLQSRSVSGGAADTNSLIRKIQNHCEELSKRSFLVRASTCSINMLIRAHPRGPGRSLKLPLIIKRCLSFTS